MNSTFKAAQSYSPLYTFSLKQASHMHAKFIGRASLSSTVPIKKIQIECEFMIAIFWCAEQSQRVVAFSRHGSGSSCPGRLYRELHAI